MSKRSGILFLLLLLLAGVTACGLLPEAEEPSGPIEAIPLEPENEAGAPAADAETTGAGEPADPSESKLRIYQINQATSQVRFELDEDLRGSRQTVVGTTDQVSGEIAVDLSDLSTAQVGTIQINARTLATDNNLRNRAIGRWILETNAYEFITFAATAINGLPASINIGDQISFTIEGDLSIRDITRPALFEVSATATSETQLTGSANARVSRGEFDLNIPDVPNVANVEDEVELYIDFVANHS